MKWVKGLAVALFVLIVLGTLFFAWFYSSSGKSSAASLIEKNLAESGIKIHIDKLDYDLVPLTLRGTGVTVYGGKDNQQKFLTAEKLELSLPYSSLRSDNLVITKLKITNAHLDGSNLPQNTKKSNGTFEIQDFTVENLSAQYEQWNAQNVIAHGKADSNGATIRDFSGNVNGSQLTAKGTVRNFDHPEYQLDYTLAGDATIAAELSRSIPKLKGPFQTKGQISGKETNYKLKGDLSSDSLSVDSTTPFALSGDYNIDTTNSRPYELHLKWNGMPMAVANALATDLPKIASNSNGTLHYTGGTDLWSATGEFQAALTANSNPGLPVTGNIAGQITHGRIELEPNTLSTGRSRIQYSGWLDANSMNLKLNADVRSLSDFRQLKTDLPRFGGAIRFDGTVAGRYSDLVASGNAQVNAKDLSVQAKGQYGVQAESVQAELSGNVQGAYFDPATSGNIQFSGTASGSVNHPVLHATLSGEGLQTNGVDIGEVTANVDSDGRTARATASIPKFSSNVDAAYTFANRNFQFNGNFTNVDAVTLKPFLPPSLEGLTGTMSGTLRASGNASHPKDADAVFTLDQAQFARNDLQVEIAPASTVHLRQRNLEINAAVKTAKSAIQLGGSMGIEGRRPLALTAKGDIDIADLASLQLVNNSVPTTGMASFDVNIGGTTSSPVLTGSASAKTPQSTIQISGTAGIGNNRPLALIAKGTVDLANLPLVTNSVAATGIASFDVNIGGTTSNPVLAGTASAPAFEAHMPSSPVQLTNGNATVNLSSSGIQVQAKGLLNGAPLELTGLMPQSNAPGNLNLTIQDMNLTQFSPELSGTASLHMEAKGTGTDWTRWSGTAAINPNNVYIQDTSLEAPEAIQVRMERGQIVLQQVTLRAAGLLDLTASGTVDLTTKKIDARVNTQSDLSLISHFVSGYQASGETKARITVTGTLANPQMSGIAEVHKGMFRVQGYPFLLENIELVAPITRDKVDIQQMTANMGGGKITGHGTVRLSGKESGQMALQITARNIGNNYPSGFRSQMDADLTVSNQGTDYLIKGDVNVLRSAYRRKIDPNTELLRTLMSKKAAVAPDQGFSNRVKLQVDVHTEDDLIFESDQSKIRTAIAMQIFGSMSRPKALGEANVRRGSQLVYRNIVYYVEYATLNFTGKDIKQPAMHVRLAANVDEPIESGAAVRTTHRCEVVIELHGSLENLNKNVATDGCDTLTPENAISFLMFGELDPYSVAGRRHIAQQQLASLLTGQLFSHVGEEFGKSVGFSLEPQLLLTEGDPTAQFTLGRQSSRRFHLSYSIPLNSSNEKTLIEEYQVGRNFYTSLAEREDGSYAAAINHRIRFGSGFRETKAVYQPQPPPKISRIDLVNHSEMTDAAVQNALQLNPGDVYDFWTVRDRIDRLKSNLQTGNFLFPTVEIEETESESKELALTVRIEANGIRQMTFDPPTIATDKDLVHYRTLWREGFSEAGVLQLIIDDLERRQWEQGYFQAEVKETTESSGEETNYHFAMTPGAPFPTVNFVFNGTAMIRGHELEENLQEYYSSRNEMAVEAIHSFRDFKDKILAEYVKEGYLDAKIKTNSTTYDPTAGVVTEEVTIEEGPVSKITDIVITGASEFPHKLEKNLKLRKGDTYLPLAVGDDEYTISQFYTDEGYLKFEMETGIEKSVSGIILHYDMKTGAKARVSDVQIVGNQTTNRGLIQDALQLKKGDELTPKALSDAQDRLYRLGVFQRVQLRNEETSTPGDYVLTVEVAERRRYEARYGARYDSEVKEEGDLQLTDFNVFGTASRASIFGKASSDDKIYRFLYFSPYLLHWNWNGMFVASRERTDPPLPFLITTTLSFEQRTPLTTNFVLVNGIKFTRTHTTIFDTIDQHEINFDNNISRLLSGFVWETRDDPFNAKHGNFLSTNFEWAPKGLGSNYTFIKSYTQFYHYRPVSGMTWASGVRIGLASTFNQGTLLSSERYFAGGKDTLRGFQLDKVGPVSPFTNNPLGGNAVFILNEELRIPIISWLGGVVFYDGGNVYPKASDFSFADIRNSAGVGIRIIAPFGFLGRVDLGVNLSPHEDEPRSVLHFTFGQIF